jgi:hypothetical protein
VVRVTPPLELGSEDWNGAGNGGRERPERKSWRRLRLGRTRLTLHAASKAVRCGELRVARGEKVVHAADGGREGGRSYRERPVVGRPGVRPLAREDGRGQFRVTGPARASLGPVWFLSKFCSFGVTMFALLKTAQSLVRNLGSSSDEGNSG